MARPLLTVREGEGAFSGALEVSQDITDIKSIEGEGRLLNWDIEQSGNSGRMDFLKGMHKISRIHFW